MRSGSGLAAMAKIPTEGWFARTRSMAAIPDDASARMSTTTTSGLGPSASPRASTRPTGTPPARSSAAMLRLNSSSWLTIDAASCAMVTWSRPSVRVDRSEFASTAWCRSTRRLLFRALRGARALGFVDLGLIRLLRRLETGRCIGEVLVALLVLLGLAARGFRTLARHLGFARGALLGELVGSAAILVSLLLRDLVFLGTALVVDRLLARCLLGRFLCFRLLTLGRLHLLLGRTGILGRGRGLRRGGLRRHRGSRFRRLSHSGGRRLRLGGGRLGGSRRCGRSHRRGCLNRASH